VKIESVGGSFHQTVGDSLLDYLLVDTLGILLVASSFVAVDFAQGAESIAF